MTENECDTCEDRDTCEYSDDVPMSEIAFGLFEDGSVRMMSTMDDRRQSLQLALKIIEHMLDNTEDEAVH